MIVLIEPMSERDLAAVLMVEGESFAPSETSREGATVGADAAASREAQLREELGRAWAHLRVARDEEGQVVGYLLYWHVVDELHLLNVAVAARARRRGVGRELVRALIAYGSAHGATRVLLEVRASNAPAIALYEAFGFERFHLRRGYYADGEDAIEMSLSFPR